MSHDGSWRRNTWTPPKRFKSSVISMHARRWEPTGALFNSRTRAARLPDWHSPRLSRRQLSRLIVFSPLNPEEVTTLGECEIYSALLLKCTVRNKNGWDIQFSSSRSRSVETVVVFWMRQADGPSSLGRKGQNVLQ